MDVGCGSGYPIASYLSQHGLVVTGIDASRELLKIAKQKFSNLQWIYGDMRTISHNKKYDAVIAWDSFFHLPKVDQELMFLRFANWLKNKGQLLFTTGDAESEIINSEMLGQVFSFYSLEPKVYKKLLEKQHFKMLLCEKDQDEEPHLVWIAEYNKL